LVVDLCEERTDHVLDLVETLGAEEQWLIVGDVISLDTHPANVERSEFGLSDLLNLSVRGEEPRAISADFGMLAYHTELQGEPKDFGHEFQRLGCLNPSCGLASHPVERGETIMGQAIAVP